MKTDFLRRRVDFRRLPAFLTGLFGLTERLDDVVFFFLLKSFAPYPTFALLNYNIFWGAMLLFWMACHSPWQNSTSYVAHMLYCMPGAKGVYYAFHSFIQRRSLCPRQQR